MIDLTAHIEYLLMNHDCVVAPGLGAFLAHETPARYDSESGQFMPPTRSLGFNQALTINDGLLAESVARRCGISLDLARTEIDTAISSFRNQLEEVKTLPLGNLGEMSISEGSLVFEPSASSAVSFRYGGFSPIAITPIIEDASLERTSEDIHESKIISIPTPLKVAASMIILIVVCGLFLTTGNLLGNRHTNFASLDSGLRNSNIEASNIAPINHEETIQISREIELNISVPKEDICSTAHVTAQPSDLPGRYILVVGSFPSKKLAIKHIGDDSTLSIIEMGDKFRVYAASASSMDEASVHANTLRDKYPTVWICRR